MKSLLKARTDFTKNKAVFKYNFRCSHHHLTMKKLLIIACFLLSSQFSFGQTVSTSDSLQIRTALQKVFKNFENPNYTEFQKIAATEIWCLICDSGQPPKPASQKLSSKDFYVNNLKHIASSTEWKRARKATDTRLHRENNSPTNITVFITLWKPDELAVGHEGAELGIHFKKEDGVFKFSGIETIP